MGRRSRMTITAMMAVAVALLAATPAQAARVRIDGGKLVIDNASTEVNAVSVTAGSGFITVLDTRHDVNAASGCSQVGDSRAQCPAGGVSSIEASLGGFDDTYDSTVALPSLVDGGTGDDFLKGGPGADVIEAGLGLDSLDGRGGNDTLRGQGGPDLLIAGPGADVFDGGDNPVVEVFQLVSFSYADTFDSVSDFFNAAGQTVSILDLPDGIEYAGHTTGGVSITLDSVANDGPAGEGDNVRNVEILGGTVHSDTLVGSSFPDVLIGTPGGSQIAKPVLVSDSLSGLGGGDVVDARGGAKDAITCGSASDFAALDLVDPAVPDCETTERAAIRQHPLVLIRRLRVRGRLARVRLSCPRKARRTCAGRLTIRSGGRRVGRRAFRLRRGRARTVTVVLSRRTRGRVRVTATGRDRNRKRTTSSRVFRVR